MAGLDWRFSRWPSQRSDQADTERELQAAEPDPEARPFPHEQGQLFSMPMPCCGSSNRSFAHHRNRRPASGSSIGSTALRPHLSGYNVDAGSNWSLAVYALARYPDKLVGHDVLCNSFRNPAHLAKMAATAQAFSGGAP